MQMVTDLLKRFHVSIIVLLYESSAYLSVVIRWKSWQLPRNIGAYCSTTLRWRSAKLNANGGVLLPVLLLTAGESNQRLKSAALDRINETVKLSPWNITLHKSKRTIVSVSSTHEASNEIMKFEKRITASWNSQSKILQVIKLVVHLTVPLVSVWE